MLKDRTKINNEYRQRLQDIDEKNADFRERVLKKFVYKQEKFANKNIEKFSAEEWITFFRMKKIGLVYFHLIKKEIEAYYQYLISMREIENQNFSLSHILYEEIENNGRYRERFFRDIDDLHHMFQEASFEVYSDEIAILLLRYYQIEISDIIKIQIKDIKEDGICIGLDKILLDKKTIEKIKPLVEGKQKWLFEKSNGKTYSESALFSKINRMNKEIKLSITSKYYGKKINLHYVAKSGFFHNILMHYIEEDVHPTDIAYSTNQEFWRNYSDYTDFKGWLEYFYGHRPTGKRKRRI